MATMAPPMVQGTVAEGFEPVRAAFLENVTDRGEVGGACCVHRFGERVVDLWGGVRDRRTGDPWRPDTMAVVHSTTKGLAAMVLAVAHSRRWLDYDELVSAYWPEFSQGGKARITVRQLLAHQAGLFAFDEKVDRDVVADLDRLAAVMAGQRPAWDPGERQASIGSPRASRSPGDRSASLARASSSASRCPGSRWSLRRSGTCRRSGVRCSRRPSTSR